MNSISARQFAVFRIVLGIYLAIHFAQLIAYGAELFSNKGVLANPKLNFTYGIFPNPLEHWDSPAFVSTVLVGLFLLAILFTTGVLRRTAAILLWFGWACLFNRNNLIHNPSIAYIGLLLLLTVIVPTGESLDSARVSSSWRFPAMVYWTAWALMAAGYSFSGWTKLSSPSWVDGSGLFHVLNNPLARCGPIRDLLLTMPPSTLRILSWATLTAELLFLPLSLLRQTRIVAWGTLTAIHLGILTAVNFTDLSVGMLMIHLFTYDPTWFQSGIHRLRKF